MRNSVIRQIVYHKTIIDIVKTNHFIQRCQLRSLNLDDILFLIEKSLDKAMNLWYKRNYKHTQGIIQKGSLNVMFGIHYNYKTKNVDFEIVSAIIKDNFITNNLNDIVVIKYE